MEKTNKVFATLIKVIVGLFGLTAVLEGCVFTYFGGICEITETVFPLIPFGIFMIFGGLAILICDVVESIKGEKENLKVADAH